MRTIIVKSIAGIIIITTFLFGVFSCEDRNFDNPYDPEVDIDSLTPYDLAVEDISIFEKKLIWKCKAKNHEAFVIEKKAGQGTWEEAKIVEDHVKEWIDTEIVLNQNYNYQVKTAFGEKYTPEETIAFKATIPAPSEIIIEKISDLSYKVSWSDNAQGEQGYRIDRRRNDEAWKTDFGQVDENQTEFVDTNVFINPQKNINMEYRIYAYYQQHESAKITANTNAALTAPTNFQIQSNTISSATLSWQDNSEGEDGFRVERSYDNSSWEEIATTQYTSYEDNAFELNTQVFYRVSSYYSEYHSDFAEKDFDANIPAPTDLEIQENTISSVTLSWQNSSEGEDGFRIERSYDNSSWEEIATTQGTSYEDNDFKLNTQVSYRVSSYYNEYHSDFAEKDFDATIPAPTDLEIQENTISSVTLSWQNSSEGEDGFRIERCYDNSSWEEIATTQGTSYEDNAFELNTQVFYRVSSYYNDYYSGFAEKDFDAIIPEPENFEITINSFNSLTLNWNYPYSGHSGFQIDRKEDDGSWATEYQVVDAGSTSLSDNVDLISHCYSYRIITRLNDYQSNEVEKTVSALIDMVNVTGGAFEMGCIGDAQVCHTDEFPVHSVNLSSFYISKYEITNSQYAEFLNGINCNSDGSYNDDEFGYVEYIDMDYSNPQVLYSGGQFVAESGKENHPVIMVTWYGANAFAHWAGGRLPTEAEWEFAARGGNQSQGYQYSGSDNLDEVGWYDVNSSGQTYEVGQKQPNEIGIYDMSGNVWERCQDWYDNDYYSNSPENNPQGPSSGTDRVMRGGSYVSAFDVNCRVTLRGENNPEGTYGNVGFRIAR